MKPFDLTRAQAGDPIITRSGRPVRMAPMKLTVWLNVYPTAGDKGHYADAFSSEEFAENFAHSHRIGKARRIELEV